jgi:hypothetical protein
MESCFYILKGLSGQIKLTETDMVIHPVLWLIFIRIRIHFDADPDTDSDPTPSLTHVGNLKIFALPI